MMRAAPERLRFPARLGQQLHMADQVVEGHRRKDVVLIAVAVKLAQPADDRATVLRRQVDEPKVFLRFLLHGRAGVEQLLAERDDGREGVVEIMRDAAGHATQRAQPLLLHHLLLGLLQAGSA